MVDIDISNKHQWGFLYVYIYILYIMYIYIICIHIHNESSLERAFEVFELHFYAVFLDVKGDKVLLEQLFRWLSAALQLPLASGPQLMVIFIFLCQKWLISMTQCYHVI